MTSNLKKDNYRENIDILIVVLFGPNKVPV